MRDTMEIEDADGRTVPTFKKALVAPLRERMTVSVEGGPALRIQGNLLDHEYRIEQDGVQVAEVSKRWFRVADNYGAEIARVNTLLLLAVTAGIDAMTDVR
jgi:uncharacterized protein YxjI